MAADPRFFPCAGPQPLAAILAAAGGSSTADPALVFKAVASLDAAGPEEVSFLDNRRYLPALQQTKAGAVVVAAAMAAKVPAGAVVIVVKQPALAFARVCRLFHPPEAPLASIHPTAVVAADAVLGEGCQVEPYAVIGAGARLGAGCWVGPHAVVGAGVEMGPGCRLHAHTSISHAIAGARVVLHPGARVGQEGFGLVFTPEGQFETAPQLGVVRLGDGVELGANTCVDRGAQSDTVIGPGTRIDNLVQVAHNVRMGRNCVIAGMAGLAGSATLEDYVTLGAQVGVAGHLTVGSKARVGGQAGVIADVPAGSDVLGSPALPLRDAVRSFAYLRNLGRSSSKNNTGEAE